MLKVKWTCPYCNHINEGEVKRLEGDFGLCTKCVKHSRVSFKLEVNTESIRVDGTEHLIR